MIFSISKKMLFLTCAIFFAFFILGCEDIQDTARAGDFEGLQEEGEESELLEEESSADSDEEADGEDTEEIKEGVNFSCDSSLGIIIDDFDKSICFFKEFSEDTMIFTRAPSYCNDIESGGMDWSPISYEEAQSLVDFFADKGIESDLNVHLNEAYGFENTDRTLYWTNDFEDATRGRGWVVDLPGGSVYWMDMSRTQSTICVARESDN